MEILVYLLLGAALAVGFLHFRIRPATDKAQHFAFALVVVAFIYVAFAMAAMESMWLLVEIGGVLLFLGFALLGTKKALYWLALGWTLHILWDVGLHLLNSVSFVPVWYPILCISFDLVVAAYIVRVIIAAPRSNEPSLA